MLDGSFGSATFQVGANVGETISVGLTTSVKNDGDRPSVANRPAPWTSTRVFARDHGLPTRRDHVGTSDAFTRDLADVSDHVSHGVMRSDYHVGRRRAVTRHRR